MAFSKRESGIPTRVFSYGCLPPEVNGELFEEQMRLSHRYQVALVWVEREKRTAILEASRKFIPALGPIYDELDVLYAQRDANNNAVKMARSHSKATITSISQVEKDTEDKNSILNKKIDALKEKRGELYKNKSPELIEEENKIHERAKALCKEVYHADTNLYTENKRLVGNDHQRACSTTSKTLIRDDGSIVPWHERPPVPRYTGEGRVGVQANPVIFSDKVATGTKFQIDPVPEHTFQLPRGERKKASRTKCRIRVGSDGKAPIWCEFPMILHRPIPTDARISWAWILRTKEADKWKYQLQLSFESSAFLPKKVENRKKAIALDLGWRRRGDDGVRVAYWADSEGKHGEIQINEEVHRGLKKVDDLISIRRKMMNEMGIQIMQWRKSVTDPWFLTKTSSAAHWLKRARFIWLFRDWQTHRFEGDSEIYEKFLAWYKQELHLFRWEYFQRDSRLRNRREQFRLLTKKLAMEYDYILIEDFKTSKVRKKPTPVEGSQGEGRKERRIAAIGSPAEFIEVCEFMAGKHLSEIIRVPAPMTTRKCHWCGFSDKWEKERELIHTCVGCKKVFDQDYNAALNILDLGLASLGEEKKAA